MEEHKKIYLSFKKLLGRLSNQDIVGQALASAITVEQVRIMEDAVREYEDMGFALFTQEKINN